MAIYQLLWQMLYQKIVVLQDRVKINKTLKCIAKDKAEFYSQHQKPSSLRDYLKNAL